MNTNPGNRPMSLATHLRRAASLIRSGAVPYDWQSNESCNCGIVARVITGLSGTNLGCAIQPFKVFPSNGQNSWAHIVARACPITGVPENVFFRQLHEAGMRYEDFNHLERQSDPIICDMVSKNYTQTIVKTRWWGKKETEKIPAKTKADSQGTLPAYLECWAELIEEYNAAHPAPAYVDQRPAVSASEDQRLEDIELRPLAR